MEFCPKCGTVLIQKGKKIRCSRCNYSTKGKVKIKTSEKIEDGKTYLKVKIMEVFSYFGVTRFVIKYVQRDGSLAYQTTVDGVDNLFKEIETFYKNKQDQNKREERLIKQQALSLKNNINVRLFRVGKYFEKTK